MTAPPSATVERQDVIAALKVSAANILMGRQLKLRAIALLEADAALPRAPEVQRLAEAAFKANYRAGMNGLIDDHTAAAAEASFRQALAAPPVDAGWDAAIEAAAKAQCYGCRDEKPLTIDGQYHRYDEYLGECTAQNIRVLARPAAILAQTTKEE